MRRLFNFLRGRCCDGLPGVWGLFGGQAGFENSTVGDAGALEASGETEAGEGGAGERGGDALRGLSSPLSCDFLKGEENRRLRFNKWDFPVTFVAVPSLAEAASE